MYPPELVKPMIEELTSVGFEELKTAAAVKQAIEQEGTTLVVVNSVCGCAARNARPAATEEARQYMLPFPPSSPSIALFKDGELVHMLERHHIEGRMAEVIAENLQQAYNEYC